MKYKELKDGLFLDDYQIEIDWNIELSTFIKEIKDIESTYRKDISFNYIGYSVKSKILGLPYDFLISFGFIKERLRDVSISMTEKSMTENHLDFDTLQIELEKILGKSRKSFNLFHQSKKSFYWKFDKVILEHYLIERFGEEELLQFRIK